MTPLGDCASPAALTSHTSHPAPENRAEPHLRVPDTNRRQSCQVLGPAEVHAAPGLSLPLCTWEAARLARLTATLRAPTACRPLQRRGRNSQPPTVPRHLQGKGDWRATGMDPGARMTVRGEFLFHIKSC